MKPLSPERLCLRTAPERLAFETTANLPVPDGPVGQARAMRAIAFGAKIAQPGYNIFVAGPQGSGKRTSIKRALERMAAAMPPPPDWAYVHNFASAHVPRALKFPAGDGAQFKAAMKEFVEALKAAMGRLFESEEYRKRKNAIESEYRTTVDTALDRLKKLGEAQGLALVERDGNGLDFIPGRDGLALSEDDYRKLPKAQRDDLENKSKALRSELERTVAHIEAMRAKAIEKVRSLDRELGEREVRALMGPLSGRFQTNRDVHAHVEAVFQDVMTHLDALQAAARGDENEEGESPQVPFHRYEVNLLVDNTGLKGAPVINLPLPSLSHLVGKVEHVPLLVTIITDFMFIRAGGLHKANGGFLLIDALDLLQQDVSWETLKRALRQNAIKIENLAEVLDRSQTVSIRPEPIPLDIKIVLFGEAWLFHRLRELDPDFAEFFKVQADFSTSVDRDDTNCGALLALLADVARNDGLKQLDRTGAARLLDEASRASGDAEKISVRTGRLTDLLREADHFAGEAGRSLVSGADVARAVASREDRAGRLKALEHELIRRNIVFIDTDGEKVGQVNGLTVLSVPGFAFGVPARITARVRPGDGRVTDIERLAEFSGPSHAKGVQILSGYLNGHYSQTRPLSLSASLAFEQSYGPIDGDSASAAELIAILSAIADVPLKQGIAITGSINQHGAIQPIGGANEKIEGFFDVLMQRHGGATSANEIQPSSSLSWPANAGHPGRSSAALTGWPGFRSAKPGHDKDGDGAATRNFPRNVGVIIPKANAINLMLRDDVVAASREGRFNVWAVEHVDEAIEILTGYRAGARARGGAFPRGTFNRRVSDRLTWFARPRILRPIRLDGWW